MADELILTISGEDSDLGDRNVPFAEHYTINCSQKVDITVTETLDSVIQLRSYTASANSEQTASIEMGGLSQGQHTLVITAAAEGVTATRTLAFTLPITYLSPLDADLGDKGERFTIPYMAKTFSGAELQITEKLDGRIHREYTAVSGEAQEMTVNTEKLVDTEHTVEIIATGDGETKNARAVFRVAPIVLASGGSVQEFQDGNGDPVYPATIAKAVMTTNGESVEKIFSDLPPDFYEFLAFDVIRTSSVWTAPKAKNQAFRVFCVGGGGGGGSAPGTGYRGGGGGGGYVSIADLTFPEGTQVSVVCGAGGGSDGNGGATSFGDYLSAEGGKKGYLSKAASGGGYGGDGGSGGGSAGGVAGNGSDYGGGGGAAVAQTDKTSVVKGGDGGLYSGGGGAGGHSSLLAGKGGSGGTYGGSGGGTKKPGQDAEERLSVSIVDALFDCTALRNSGNYAGGSISSGSTAYGGGGGAGAKSDGGNGGSYAGGGGGGFCGNGGNGGSYAGGGGGGFFGNGGNGSTYGGGGGGGFFCKGGNGFTSAVESSAGSGGGGGGFFSDGKDGYDSTSSCFSGAGGDGGVLIMYFKEDDK